MRRAIARRPRGEFVGTASMITRLFKGDKWNHILGSRIPLLAQVEVVRFYPRRRVLIRHEGRLMNTMLWCLKKFEKRD